MALKSIESRSNLWLAQAIRRIVARTALRTGLIALLVALPFGLGATLVDVTPPWMAAVAVLAIGVVSGLLAGRMGRAAIASESARLQLLHRLDRSANANDALVTSLTARVGDAGLLALMETEAASHLDDRALQFALPTSPRRIALASAIIVVLIAGATVAVEVNRARHLADNGQTVPATNNAPATDQGTTSDPKLIPRTTGPRTTAPGPSSASGNADSSAPGGSSSNSSDPMNPSGDQTGVQPSSNGDSNSPEAGPRTAEPRYLIPRAGDGRDGRLPETSGPQSAPKGATPVERMPWERPTEVPGLEPDAPKPENPDTADEGLPTGERRRPPLRRPKNPTPPSDAKYVEQPLKIIPEVRDGDRKSIPVAREVYAPGESSESVAGSGAPTAGEGGQPAPAHAPNRETPMPKGALTEAEREWLEQWIRRFAAK